MAPARAGGRGGLGGLRHLARRLVSALVGRGPAPVDEAAVLARMSEPEQVLHRTASTADRRHAVRSAMAILDAGGDDETVVASALHDVGKSAAGLGTPGRVVASLVIMVAGRGRTGRLRNRSGLLGRIGTYAAHPEVGAAMLAAAGASDLAVTWAREHHRPVAETGLDADVAARLWDADRA